MSFCIQSVQNSFWDFFVIRQKNKLIFVVTALFALLSCTCLASLANGTGFEDDYELKVAKAIEVSDFNNDYLQEELFAVEEQLVKLEILGDENHQEVFVRNVVPDDNAYAIKVEAGRKYMVAVEDEGEQISITDYYREPVILWLFLIFAALVLIIGRMQGLKALLSLTLTALAILFFFIPGIKLGMNPILMAVAVAIFATGSTMLLIAGFTHKSLAATVGTTGGVAIAGFLALFCD